MSDQQAPILPGDFPIKIIGKSSAEFIAAVKKTVLQHFADTSDDRWSTQESQAGRFISLTVTVYVREEIELKALHEDLMKIPGVVMVI